MTKLRSPKQLYIMKQYNKIYIPFMRNLQINICNVKFVRLLHLLYTERTTKECRDFN